MDFRGRERHRVAPGSWGKPWADSQKENMVLSPTTARTWILLVQWMGLGQIIPSKFTDENSRGPNLELSLMRDPEHGKPLLAMTFDLQKCEPRNGYRFQPLYLWSFDTQQDETNTIPQRLLWWSSTQCAFLINQSLWFSWWSINFKSGFVTLRVEKWYRRKK